jgi:exodeoxyribonuclease VII large subunit
MTSAEPLSDVEPTFSVGELARAINASLARDFGSGVWVRGEIQSWNARGPHAYFQLAEEVDGQRAVIQVNLFADVRRRIRPILEQNRLTLDDGVAVRIFGIPDFWAPGGRLGLKMRDIDPRFTLGDLAMAREAVLGRLRASDRFDDNRMLELSPLPLRLGLVTSEGTAAFADFTEQLSESGLGFSITLSHCAVQGEGAEHQIAAAIGRLGTLDLDAIAVIRGGGSRTDLATFDAEIIAEAILACPLPVVTGIGHEIDRSIADEVAHSALKTPTACAAMLIDRVRDTIGRAEGAWARIAELGRLSLAGAEGRIAELTHRIARHTHTAVERADMTLDQRRRRVITAGARVLESERVALERHGDRLGTLTDRLLDGAESQLALAEARIGAHDPARLLARGWSITTDADGAVIRSVDDVVSGDGVRTHLVDGVVTSTVVTVSGPDPDPTTVGDVEHDDG